MNHMISKYILSDINLHSKDFFLMYHRVANIFRWTIIKCTSCEKYMYTI